MEHYPKYPKVQIYLNKSIFMNDIGEISQIGMITYTKSSNNMNYILKGGIFILLVVLFQISSFAQPKYWILFEDKGNIDQIHSHQLLSPEAYANRLWQGITIDIHDYPVSQTYRNQLQELGIRGQRVSKWLNGISAYLTEEQRQTVSRLSFVKEIRQVQHFSRPAEVTMACDTITDLDTYTRQLSMLELDLLHAYNYTGKGITIAVFDNGFRAVDTLQTFQHIFEEDRLVATWDFVDNEENVYDNCQRNSFCKHGTNVFSVLAARSPGKLIGSAPDANYILLRTENDISETHQEEDNWIAGAEFADSLGAQVFSTSLSYRNFDAGEGNYSFEDMDGETALITLAADIAASRGIIVVNSAGNDGNSGISAPADGHDVITVGSVDQCESYSSFSSQGPSADGRIKPDVTAMGRATFVMEINGETRRANGTSFSSPLISGFMACLLQASPESSREQLYQALIESADRFQKPDNFYGYGIPSASKAFEILRGSELSGVPNFDLLQDKQAILYPNPTQGTFYLTINGDIKSFPSRVEIIDAMGRRIISEEIVIEPPYRQMVFNPRLARGLYHILIHDLESKNLFFSGKVVVE